MKVFSAIQGFDYQIEEFHHNKKKDKPSGTAISLQENLEKAVGRKLPEPLAIRGGGIYGVHKIYAMSDEEVLMFEHSALNRAVFAKGAVEAAMFLAIQTPGLSAIRDALYGKNK
ncbi:4-hydroxy-tetrahydrodipicolinate reductase [compost metagenome]